AERGRGHGDRHAAMRVGAVALKELVRRQRQEDVEIAGGPAAHAGFALARQANARAVLDAGRNVDRQRALARDAARPRTGRAGIVDHLAAAMTGRAGALEREEALRVADAALAAAGLAGMRPRARPGARTGAGLAGDRGGNADLGGLAGERVVERDLHVVAEIGAALAARRPAAASTAHAEQVVEDIREGGGEFGAEAVVTAAHALLEGGMTEPVVGGALVAVLEDVVGLVQLLEPMLPILVARIAVGMMLHREPAERRLELRVVCGARDSQNLVVIALAHVSAHSSS